MAMSEERNRWILLIKELRVEHDASILEAERIALSRPEWRRWVERQTNADRKCQRMALDHIKKKCEESLLEETEGLIKVR